MTNVLQILQLFCVTAFLGTHYVLGGIISPRANRFILTESSSTGIFSGNEYLDSERKYDLAWEIDSEAGSILFAVVAETNGYVGLGLSFTGTVNGSDIFIGGSNHGLAYSGDYHVRKNGRLIKDQSQDWTLLRAEEIGIYTKLKFSRKLNTCDAADLEIMNKTLHVIWTVGKDDNLTYINSTWESKSVTFIPGDVTWIRYECKDARGQVDTFINNTKVRKFITTEDWGYTTEDWGYTTEDWGYTTEDWGYTTEDWGYTTEDWGYTTEDDWGYTTEDWGYTTEDWGYTTTEAPTTESTDFPTTEGNSTPNPGFNDTISTTTRKCDWCNGNHGVVVNMDVDININISG